MGQLRRDLKYALRVFTHNPGFTIIAVLVLAIAIGANTAVFSVVYSVLLKPLNYADPDRLVTVLTDSEGPISPADYLDFKSQATSFTAMEAAQAWGGAIATPDRAEVIPGLRVSAGMFAMLGVQPERGRVFREGEDQPDAAPVIVIGHKLWQERLGADPNAVGRTLLVDAHAYTIVGVMPPQFQFAPFWQTEAQMWIPFDLSNRKQDRSGRSVRLFARLKPGVSLEQARTEMTSLASRLRQLYPATNNGVSVSVLSLQQKVVGPVQLTLVGLFATVAFVLLIACANIANLLLTRAVARRREIAVRVAIGAGRMQVIRQLTTESVLLSLMGGVGGIGLGWAALRLIARVLPVASLPRQGEVALHPWVLVFAAVIAMSAGVMAGLFPAFDSMKVDVSENLKEGSRGSQGGQRRTRGVLIAAEVSLALILLVCAGLMMQTLHKLNGVDAGFNPHALLTMQVYAPPSYDTAEKRMALFERVDTAIRDVTGVKAVGAINHLPISGDVWTLDYVVPGRPAPQPGMEPGGVYRVVRPGYFTAMQIPLLRGREFTEHDRTGSAPVVIVNETLARHQWPAEDPVGKTILVHGAEEKLAPYTIIGVVRNVRQSDWTGDIQDEFYLPYLQHASAFGLSDLAYVARTSGGDTALVAVEERIRSIDPQIAISRPEMMDEVIAEKLWRSRLTAMLLGIFAAIALVLASVGIYGVISYSVGQREQEIGIRVALGATRTGVIGMVLRESMVPVVGGILFGVASAAVTARWLAALLYGVSPTDPTTFAAVVCILLSISGLAAAIPAYRLLRSDIASTLRV